MIAIDAETTKITGVRPRLYSAVFECLACGHTMDVNQPNEQELIEPLECVQIDGGRGRNKAKPVSYCNSTPLTSSTRNSSNCRNCPSK